MRTLPLLALIACGGSTPQASCPSDHEDRAVYYEDRDGDGVGSADASQATCTGEPPFASWVVVAGDCDDQDSARAPDLPELCNGIDDDCNDLVDDGLSCVDWYQDLDGDGFGAGPAQSATEAPGIDWSDIDGDCDDNNPAVAPGAAEVCNGIDDNCVDGVDEGDPFDHCLGDPLGPECAYGGCYCAEEPVATLGVDCDNAIDLGSLTDDGQLAIAVTNSLPGPRDVWYRFRAVDGPAVNNYCDNFHVTALFTDNPDERFELEVRRGLCNAFVSPQNGYEQVTPTRYDFATDMRYLIPGVGLVGECPCTTPPATPPQDGAYCLDDTADYFVAVRRVDPTDQTCVTATLEVSNGVYDQY